MKLPFSQSEYGRRCAATCAEMSKREIDLLVVTDPSNIYYLSGYDAWSFYVEQALLVSSDGDIVWFGREMDVPSAYQTTWLAPENCVSYGDSFVQSETKNPMQALGALIEGRNWHRGAVGVEMGAHYFTARAYTHLVKSLPNAKLVDANLLVNWIRVVKSDAEIEYMRQAGQIVESAMRKAVDAIGVGVRQCDVVAEIYAAQMRGTSEFGGVYPTSKPHFVVGEQANCPHASWTDETIKRQSPVNIEIAGCRLRYHAPLSRTVYVGTPPDEYLGLASTVVEGLSTAMESVRAGEPASLVEQRWRETISKRGFEKRARVGYSIGIGYPPTWGEGTISLRPEEETVLQPNMTIHIMTGLWVGSTGVTITESVRVTSSGYEALTSFPRQLFVKD